MPHKHPHKSFELKTSQPQAYKYTSSALQPWKRQELHTHAYALTELVLLCPTPCRLICSALCSWRSLRECLNVEELRQHTIQLRYAKALESDFRPNQVAAAWSNSCRLTLLLEIASLPFWFEIVKITMGMVMKCDSQIFDVFRACKLCLHMSQLLTLGLVTCESDLHHSTQIDAHFLDLPNFYETISYSFCWQRERCVCAKTSRVRNVWHALRRSRIGPSKIPARSSPRLVPSISVVS